MSSSKEVESLIERLEKESETDVPEGDTPDVGVVMGSDSDFDVMMGSGEGRGGALDAFMELGFEEVTDYENPPDAEFTFETYVVSAHRTPDLMYAYGETAEERGIDVIIAGAGGKSADLPNMTASVAYPIPVIGVPVQEKSVPSVIGMPQGAPLTAVDAGKSFNASLTSAQILATRHPELKERLEEYHERLRDGVGEVSKEMHDGGSMEFRKKTE
ncbi:MAG: 5-(carboxyamino)imidazole ribonucleotide mutase [Halobacteria archaeon]